MEYDVVWLPRFSRARTRPNEMKSFSAIVDIVCGQIEFQIIRKRKTMRERESLEFTWDILRFIGSIRN